MYFQAHYMLFFPGYDILCQNAVSFSGMLVPKPIFVSDDTNRFLIMDAMDSYQTCLK